MAYKGDFTKQAGGYNVTRQVLDQPTTIIRYFDTTVSGQNLSAGGYYKMIALPDDFLITRVLACTITAEGDAGVMAIRIDDDGVQLAELNINSANAGANISAAISLTIEDNLPIVTSEACYLTVCPNSALGAWKGYIGVEGIHLNTKY